MSKRTLSLILMKSHVVAPYESNLIAFSRSNEIFGKSHNRLVEKVMKGNRAKRPNTIIAKSQLPSTFPIVFHQNPHASLFNPTHSHIIKQRSYINKKTIIIIKKIITKVSLITILYHIFGPDLSAHIIILNYFRRYIY